MQKDVRMQLLPRIRQSLRYVLGQNRQSWSSGSILYVELRSGCAHDSGFLDRLEAVLEQAPEVLWSRYVPELERLVIAKAHKDLSDATVLGLIRAVEQEFDYQRKLFKTHTRFPGEGALLAQTGLQIAADVAGLALGTVLGRSKGRRTRMFTDFSALVTLVDNFPELREPLVSWLGRDNVDMLLSLSATFSESMTKGRSGGVLRMALRLQEWSAIQARKGVWRDLEAHCLDLWESASRLRGSFQRRVTPLPNGPIEDYTATSEKLAMAGFSVELANTHDLTNATAALFAAAPKPANYGREAFCIELERRLAKAGVLVVEPRCLRAVDRVSRVLVDARLLAQVRGSVSTVKPFAEVEDLYGRLERMVSRNQLTEQEDGAAWRIETPAQGERLPEAVRDWWQESGQPLSDLRLLWRGPKLIAAALVQEVLDSTVETVLARVRRTGASLVIVGEEQDIPQSCRVYQQMSYRQARRSIRRWQADGEVILAVGWSEVLMGADIGIGALMGDGAWPGHAHLLTRDPMDTLWRFAIARDQGRKTAEQSVILSQIETFSGLILSLNKLDMETVRRIRQSANIASAIAMINGIRQARQVDALPQELRLDPAPWHAMDVDTALRRLESNLEGLSWEQARQRLSEPVSEPSALLHFLNAVTAELGGPLVPVLLAGAGLSALTGALLDAGLIGAVVAINGMVGGIQRYRTEHQLRSLDHQERRRVRCLRDGREVALEAEVLVPGDVILLEAGEVVPADCRLLEGNHLEMDESSLTGESLPVAKRVRPSYSVTLADRSSMLFEGTVVAVGEAKALVVAHKDVSESRRAHYLQPTASSGVESRLDSLTAITLPVAAFSGIGVMISGLSRNQPVSEMVGAGVSLAVAAVPEGLPLLSTMAQLAAAGRLAETGAVVRNPRAIEALGRMTVLCADKTGTLTEGALALRVVALEGELQAINSLNDDGRELLAISLMASPEDNRGKGLAHITDNAVLQAAREYNEDLFDETGAWQRIKELPFRSERGYHATLAERHGKRWICVKGAPDVLVPFCDRWKRGTGRVTRINSKSRQKILDLSHDLATRGYRVLAVAEREAVSDVLNENKIERLIFRGFLALADPVRATAREAVEALHHAGVGVKIVTGDHPVTALSIARELGIDAERAVMTGSDIEGLSDQALAARVSKVRVFARVTPRQKARIVAALQSTGEVVGMTGDGANDAAAMRLADVGIALGERSTAAARAAADLLVTDGRIETIVAAVLEGRGLWSNVRDAVALLVGGNLGEIGFTLLGSLVDGRSPLSARQLLLVNLLTDTLPALAVALRRPQGVSPEQLLGEGPDVSLGEALTRDIQWRAGLTTGITSVSWLMARLFGSPQRASTVALLALVGGQLGQAIMAGRGSREVVLAAVGTWLALAAIVQTPGLSNLFGCRPLGPLGWAQAVSAIGVSVLGSRWMPQLQHWSQTAAHRLINGVQDWLSDEEDAELIALPPPEGEDGEITLAQWMPDLTEWLRAPERMVREMQAWLVGEETEARESVLEGDYQVLH